MLAYMFPGQGSQQGGMGKSLFSAYPELCAQAETTLGYSIVSLCLDKDPTRLALTEFTQPAVFFVSCLAFLDKLAQGGPPPDLFLGHSLGLYAGLFAAGVYDLATGLRIVAERGRLMSAVPGAMSAVLGDQVDELEQHALENNFHDVDIANYNSPSQAVISGKAERVEAFAERLVGLGYRCVSLPVSGPFHSRHMEPARLRFVSFLADQPLQAPRARVVSTTGGQTITQSHMIEEMGFQFVRPVRWMQTVNVLLAAHGALQLEEVGPGQVLTRLVAQIRPH